MPRLELAWTELSGLAIVRRERREDTRGFLARLFCAEELREAGFTRPIAQVNHAVTRRRGAVRGMHFQRHPHAEAKLVSCIRGEVFDVAIDLRRGSPTFLRWHGERLSGENGRALLIPEGFAHGLQALTDDCEIIYLHTAAYHAESEGGVHPQDPRLGVAWPLEIAEMSDRDRGRALLGHDFAGIES